MFESSFDVPRKVKINKVWNQKKSIMKLKISQFRVENKLFQCRYLINITLIYINSERLTLHGIFVLLSMPTDHGKSSLNFFQHGLYKAKSVFWDVVFAVPR